MKKRYGIMLFVLTIIVIFALIVLYRLSYQRALSENEKQLTKITETKECYYIKDTDGYVTVYMKDNKTVYEYTSILTENLPTDVQAQLKDGIKVETIGDIYGFLENYSS